VARLTARACLFLCALAAGAGIPGCAKEGLPPGGPEDIEAPALAEVHPVPGSTAVSRFEPIVFVFTEAMNRASVEKALFFTPDIGPTLRVTWRGRELRLEPRTLYRENTTIVVTLGADASDQHRNRMGGSFTFAFSTGPELDEGELSGQVVEEARPAAGAWIWIYPLETAPGAVEPSPLLSLEQAYPLYITQADDDGFFEQRYMAAGRYRIFAFRDRDTNLRFDLDADPLAVPPLDLELSADSTATPPQSVSGLVLNLAPRDTLGLQLRSATPLDSVRVNLSFSEPAAEGTRPQVKIERWDAERELAQAGAPPLAITALYRPVEAPGSLLVRTAGALPGERYLVTLLEAVDPVGNPARAPRRPVLYTVPARGDTAAPRLAALTPPDSSRGLNRDTRFRLTFATEVAADPDLEWHLIGADTLALVPAWLDPRTLELTLSSDPQQGTWYRLPIPRERLRSWAGITAVGEGDPPVWQAGAPPGRGTLRLVLAGPPVPPAGGYYVFFEGAGSSSAVSVRVHRPVAGEFTSPDLPVGGYRVWGFADTDGDGDLGVGRARPFAPAEVVAILPDTLYVRDSFESSYPEPLCLRAIDPGEGNPEGGR